MRRFVSKLISRLVAQEKKTEAPKPKTLATRVGVLDAMDDGDPLDTRRRQAGWQVEKPEFKLKTISDFPLYEASEGGKLVRVGDAAPKPVWRVMDDAVDNVNAFGGQSDYAVPQAILDWYQSQSFIGYQACAIIDQQWLVNKACSMPGEDAVRHGWKVKAKGEEKELSKEQLDALNSYDTAYNIKSNLAEFDRYKNVFGIRVAIFKVDSDDKDYYEKPFNIDGITPGSYKGISQVDPIWMMPMMSAESTSDPSDIHFYDPEYWIISGVKYHRSHLIIARGPQPADILKPTYIFGGIPLTQRIYERCYAAERTANESPLLAMTKRTTALHVDMEKGILNERKLLAKLAIWLRFRDNHGIKVLGKDETMEQMDTSLADLDSVIMNQFQLVSAISKVPSTKLLGTSPKGFNATGEFEMKSYHEELESVQEHVMMPLLMRHYMILCRSLEIDLAVEAIMEPVDSMTAAELADLNYKKAQTGEILVNTVAAISPDEERNRLREDKHSGYNRLVDEDANEEPGMTPENIAALEKGEGAEETGEGNAAGAAGTPPAVASAPAAAAAKKPDASVPDEDPEVASATINAKTVQVLSMLAKKLELIESALTPEGVDLPRGVVPGRTVNAGVTGVQPSVVGIHGVVPEMEAHKLPKIKIGGLMVSVENPRGTIRKGSDLDGTQWQSKMTNHYGFIRGTLGADGEEVDCFVGPNLKAPTAFVIDQNTPDSGDFDEHKVMLGFDTIDQARQAYCEAFPADWTGLAGITPMSLAELKGWLSGGALENPLSETNIGTTGNAPMVS